MTPELGLDVETSPVEVFELPLQVTNSEHIRFPPIVAMRYFSTDSREEVVKRRDHWRERALTRSSTIGPLPQRRPNDSEVVVRPSAHQPKWLQEAHQAHKTDAAVLKAELTRQAVTRELYPLRERLPECMVAKEAIDIIMNMRRFFETRKALCTLDDVKECLNLIKELELPFENQRASLTNPLKEYRSQRARLEQLLEREKSRRGMKIKLFREQMKVEASTSLHKVVSDRETAVADSLNRRGTQSLGVLSFRVGQ